MKQELLTHYGRVRISNVPVGRDASGTSYFKINTKYINNMRKVVRVQLRSGMEMAFPPVDHKSQRAHDNEFVVQLELVVDPIMIEPMRNFFSTVTDNSTGVLITFRDVFLKVYGETRFQIKPLQCSIDHVFTEMDLNEKNGMFYHDELDTVFKLGEQAFNTPHPNSLPGRLLETEDHAEMLRDRYGFVFSVEIVDNLGKYGERYLSICNQVYKVAPRRDNNKPDGIYIVSSKPTNGRLSSDEIITNCYGFDDAEKRLGIYTTYEMAASFGDQAAARKREIIDLEHVIALAKQQAALDKIANEQVLAERDRRLKDLEYERSLHTQAMDDLKARQEHLLEMERMRLKEHYEEKSTERKDSSEMLKFLPAVLAAVGTILMAYKAFKTS